MDDVNFRFKLLQNEWINSFNLYLHTVRQQGNRHLEVCAFRIACVDIMTWRFYSSVVTNHVPLDATELRIWRVKLGVWLITQSDPIGPNRTTSDPIGTQSDPIGPLSASFYRFTLHLGHEAWRSTFKNQVDLADCLRQTAASVERYQVYSTSIGDN